ncbi:MAG: FkbM family methyltransferase [Pseudomonadota bacterium]
MASEALQGIFRSLRIYHQDPERGARMDALYNRFICPNDLVFDIGSHVGDRISSFRRLGARVVGLEPQPLAFRALQIIHGRDENVSLYKCACASESGEAPVYLNEANPTVSTLSGEFIAASKGQEGWIGQTWNRSDTIRTTTLDDLIKRHGEPVFAKIDVEGFEAEVLAGLSTPLKALSFEFTTIQKNVAETCLQLLDKLGPYRFNISLGEDHEFTFVEPLDADAMTSHILALPHEANSGDVYARRTENR